ncbi:MAG: sigma-70 family RNA polymerase sigma factor [Candidatus Aquicultorales bacterium]
MVRRYQDALYSFCFRLVGGGDGAEDLAQETFVKAYRNVGRFDTRRKFATWIYAIANNLAIDRWRTRRPDAESWEELSPADQVHSCLGLPERKSLTSETRDELEAVLMELEYDYRAAVVLRHVEGWAYSEISLVLGVPEGTAKTWVHRGCARLRRMMKEAAHYEV